MSFETDIQGRDTALVPIVKIGNIYISTNSMTFDGKDILPLLLSLPGLKESIDIEKRNYKISNVTLNISNFPYDGKIFSDRVTGTLINVPVDMYWVTPSVTTFEDAKQIYTGSVRRYDHDDKAVKLAIEDRSQAALHKDLPLPENYETGVEIPDKYKNKPIPIVFGIVDKSPCVIRRVPISSEEGLDFGNVDIYVDKEPYEILKGYVFFGDKYLEIPTVLTDPNKEDLFSLPAESRNIIDTTETQIIRLEAVNSNPITRNLLPVKESRELYDIKVIPLREKTHDLDPYISTNYSNYTSIYREGTRELLGTFVRDRSSGDLYEWDGTSRLQGIENTSNDIFNDISISATQEDVTFPGCVLDGNFSNGSFKESIGVVDYDLDMYYGNVLAVSGDHNARLSLLGGSQLQWAQRAEDFSNTADGWHSVNLESVETFIFHSNLGGDINRLKLALWSYIATGGIIAALKIKFNEFNI